MLAWSSRCIVFPHDGHGHAGRRPALFLSHEPYHRKVGLALLCPITNQIKGYPFEVGVPHGLKVSGVVLSDQVKSMDLKARGAAFLRCLPESTVRQVLNNVGTLPDA